MNLVPIDSSTPPQELVWAMPRTFFGAPGIPDIDELDAQVAFLGVPWDAGTPQPGNRTGQAAGPAAARMKSWEQFEYGHGWYDVEANRDHLVGVTMADVGDVAIQGSEVERNFDRITEAVRRIAARGALLVAVGGDHSISYPLGRGLEALGEIDIVHVDAHMDFMDELEGARYTGASQLRRLSELPFVRSVTALGVRNVMREEVDAHARVRRALGDEPRAGAGTRARRCAGSCPSRTPSMCRSTSTCSTSRSSPARRCPSPAGRATDRFARRSSRSRAAGRWSDSTSPS